MFYMETDERISFSEKRFCNFAIIVDNHKKQMDLNWQGRNWRDDTIAEKNNLIHMKIFHLFLCLSE